jgi:hypothetical protein
MEIKTWVPDVGALYFVNFFRYTIDRLVSQIFRGDASAIDEHLDQSLTNYLVQPSGLVAIGIQPG